jgi:hypothetical protein
LSAAATTSPTTTSPTTTTPPLPATNTANPASEELDTLWCLSAAATTSPTTTTPLPAINTANPALAPSLPILDPTKQYHPKWGVIKDQDFHPLTLKHQRDLEYLYQTGSALADFYFWQANLGGYCQADMVQGKGIFVRCFCRVFFVELV